MSYQFYAQKHRTHKKDTQALQDRVDTILKITHNILSDQVLHGNSKFEQKLDELEK